MRTGWNVGDVLLVEDIYGMLLMFGGSFQLLIGCVWNLSHWLEYHITYNIMMSPYFFGAYVMLDTYAVGLFTDMMIPLDIIRYSSIYTLKLISTHLFACNKGRTYFSRLIWSVTGNILVSFLAGGFDIGGIMSVHNIFMRLSLLQMCLLVIL